MDYLFLSESIHDFPCALAGENELIVVDWVRPIEGHL